ncbi:MAG: hypothetical protein WAT19_07910, partial [Ferruginibacter sp.]
MENLKNILKDYGTLIGPMIVFILGIIAIYIKYYTDRQLESWKARKKMKKLKQLIFESKPPAKHYPRRSAGDGFIHADQARNLTNLSTCCAIEFLNFIEILLNFYFVLFCLPKKEPKKGTRNPCLHDAV